MARLKRKRETEETQKVQLSSQKRGKDAQHGKNESWIDRMDVDGASDGESGAEYDSGTDEGGGNASPHESDSHSKALDSLEHEKDHKPSAQGVRALPSAQELREIFEASELYQSNAFKLQIDDLLPTISPKSSQAARAPLDAFLLALHECLMTPTVGKKKSKTKSKTSMLRFAADPQSPVALASMLASQANVAVPFPSPAPTSDTKWTFNYSPPESIMVSGSWAAGMSVKHQDKLDFSVDLEVAIPVGTLQEKDYLNDRYFHKRALYLACLAASIASAFDIEMNYDSPLDDVRMTSLLLYPRKGSEYDWSKLHTYIRIIPVQPPSSPIPPSRLAPNASNLRIASTAPSESQTQTIPTPHYNTILALSQIQTGTAHLVAIHNLSTSIPQFIPAVRLLRVWANQRGFGKGKSGCLRGWDGMGAWWGWVVGWLVEGGEPLPVQDYSKIKARKRNIARLGRGLSSYQLFRGTLDFLAHHDFHREPVFVKTVGGGHKYPPASWASLGRPIFVDPTSTINLLENVPLGSLELLRLEAAQTLRVLDSTSGDTFNPTFLRDLREPNGRSDVVLRVNLDGVRARVEDGLDILDRGSYLSFVYSSIDHILRHAMGNRVRAVAITQPSSPSRPIHQSQPSPYTSFDLCLVLDPEHAFRLIDRGPPVDAPQSETDAFRELWGDKAELRRFADGSIIECVVWEGEDDRSQIPARIVKHILARHFNLKKTREVQTSYAQLITQPESALRLSGNATSSGNKGAMQAFDELVKTIKAMDLPLSLVACLPTAEELRYTSVFAPSPIPLSRLDRIPECTRYMPVYSAIMQFEKSARWPDDLGAIQKLKLAWFETVAREIVSRLAGSYACIAMDALASPVEDGAALEVALSSGHAFRLRIYHDREKVLLEKAISDKSLQAFQRADAERALAVHIGRFIDSPRHHAAVVNLHHRHAGFSPTVRLVKRWFAAHLLSNSITPELIELLCAYIFLRADPQVTPTTGSAGFARTMAFLSGWDWRREFLAAPLYAIAGEDTVKEVVFPVEVRKIVSTAFEERRARDPGMSGGAWHIATDRDTAGVWWCVEGRGPSAMIADRVTALAKASMRLIREGLESSLNVKALFHHPLDGYDFLIHLDPLVLPRYTQNVLADEAVWMTTLKHVNVHTGDTPNILLGFDPAKELVEDIQRVYGDIIACFYDYLGGTTIGCSWNPLVRQAKPFRALLGYSTKLEGTKKVILNEDAVLHEIGRMGTGLIKEIVKQTSS